MALSGLETGKEKNQCKLNAIAEKGFCLSIYSRKRCRVVSSSNLQCKEESKRDQTFLTLKSNLLRYEILFKILY